MAGHSFDIRARKFDDRFNIFGVYACQGIRINQ